MSGSVMSIQDFLKHSTRGDKRSYLSKWKDADPYSIIVWLHTLASIIAIWRHRFPEVVVREDKQTRAISKEVWGGNFNCIETEAVLKRQSYRNKEVGGRETPPEKCPFCMMIEFVRTLVESGQLDWRTPIFRFEGTDPSKTQVLHAGGIYNAFGNKDLTADEKKQLYDASIWIKDAWAQNLMAKMNYIFAVVEHHHPEKGIQVAIEAGLLGDKVKSVIAKEMKSKGVERGNPVLNPYAIEWSFNPDKNIQFDKKYDACPLETVPITPHINKLIRETAAPDMSSMLQPPNWKTLLARWQQHALIQLPWESFFKHVDMNQQAHARPPQGAPTGNPGSHPQQNGRPPVVGQPGGRPAFMGAPPGQAQAYAPPQQYAPPPQEEMVGCDNCSQAIPISARACPHCGVQFEMDEPAAPPAAPPRLPSRSEARAARGLQQPPPPQYAPPPPPQFAPPPQYAPPPQQAPYAGQQQTFETPESAGFDDFAGEPEDEIPF